MDSSEAELSLEATMRPAEGATPSLLKLVLTNHGGGVLRNFRLALSGPARIGSEAAVDGGRIVAQLSNYCEIAPGPPAVLQPGAAWTIEIHGQQTPIRHWTDGPHGAFLILEDGSTRGIAAKPLRREGHDAPLRSGTMRLAGNAADDLLSIIPWPRQVRYSGRRMPPPGLAIEEGHQASVVTAFGELVSVLFPGEGLLRSPREGGLTVRLRPGDGSGEAYTVDLTPDEATVTAGSDTGLLYGLVTLAQMLRGARAEPNRFVFPTEARIVDRPRHGWRGSHLDVARRFYGRAELTRFLAILCWNKLNRFHWHLSDDEGFRVALDSYPQLVETAAWRGHGLVLPPLLGSGAERYGGYYQKSDIGELVQQALRWGIEVLPEIDIPGHCFALLAAMPGLRDPDETGEAHSIQSFPNNCVNPARREVYAAMNGILVELAGLFPGRYFHVGADEVPADAWSGSPQAAAMRRDLGVAGTAPLQARFLAEVQSYLTAAGKITGAWEEAAEGGGIDRDNCYLVGWRNVEASRRLAAEGYKVVTSPGQAYYLDMANGAEWEECGAGWAGWSSPEKTYALDPLDGWDDAEAVNFMGVQAAIWSEPMHTPAIFDRLVFPRLSAIAETGWTAPERKDFDRFADCSRLMPNLYGQWEPA